MLKLIDLKKLKNEKLLSVAVEMEQTLAASVWSSEFETHLKRLQDAIKLFFDAQVEVVRMDDSTQVMEAQKLAELSYRRLYLHLKPLLLSEDDLQKTDAQSLVKGLKLSSYGFERLKQQAQIDHLFWVEIMLNGYANTDVLDRLNCTLLAAKLIDNTQNYRTAFNTRILQHAEARKFMSATKLRPQLIKIIRQLYLFISVSSNEENEKLRMRQLKEMERIAHKGVKRKYVRKISL